MTAINDENVMVQSARAHDRLDSIACAISVVADLCRAIADLDSHASLDTVNAGNLATLLHLMGDGVRDYYDGATVMHPTAVQAKTRRAPQAAK